MRSSFLLALALSAAPAVLSAPLYTQDFQSVADGKVPEPPAGVMVLDGQFAVKEEGGNRFLELPGAPLETFGVLFGPNAASGVEAQARVQASKSGRKNPTFALGLNGVNGFKVRVSPAKNAVEIVQGADAEVKATAAFAWRSGEWTHLRLRVAPADGGGVTVLAKAWQGDAEPAEWTVKAAAAAMPAGAAGVWGMPFSGTPIRFDDLKVSKVE